MWWLGASEIDSSWANVEEFLCDIDPTLAIALIVVSCDLEPRGFVILKDGICSVEMKLDVV